MKRTKLFSAEEYSGCWWLGVLNVVPWLGGSDRSPRQTAVSALLHFSVLKSCSILTSSLHHSGFGEIPESVLSVHWQPILHLLHWLVEPQIASMDFKNLILISGIFISIGNTVLSVADSILMLAVCLACCLCVLPICF